MILFSKDFNKYSNCHIHTETKNESFLKLASLYKKMGISNWAFPLTLYQKELVNIDPYGDDLDSETIVKIALEAKYNPWYVFREIIRVPVQGTTKPVSFIANRANIALFWCFFNHLDFLLIQPRQTFKSGSVDSLMIYLLFIGSENLKINLVTKDAILRQENIERLKSIRNYLPYYFYKNNIVDVNNKVALTNHNLNNQYKTAIAQKSLTGANNVARGMSAPIFHIDEVPFISHIAMTLPVALAAGTTAREQAKEINGYYGNIFTTTAGERNDRDGSFVYKMMDNATIWSELFFDCKDRNHLFETVGCNRNAYDDFKGSLLINGTFSHRQLGRSDEWLATAIANSRGDKEQVKRDFLNIWTCGTSYSPLSNHLNNKIYESEIEPIFTDLNENNYILRWYCDSASKESYLASGRFTLGLDTSEAIGQDAIGMVLTDAIDLRTVLSINISETNLLTFAHWLAKFLIHYKNITLVPEMKSSARVIIDALLIEFMSSGVNPFKRIYNQIVDQPEKYPTAYREIQKSMARWDKNFVNRYRKEFGFVTNEEKRIQLFGSNFQLAANRGGHLVFDKVLSKEIRGLVVKNGRIDHKSSGHDDVCFAWLLNHWFLTNGRNLDKYGIETGKALAMVCEDGKVVGVDELKEMKEQAIIRERIDEMVHELAQSENPTLTAKMTLDLRNLSDKIKTEDNAIYNFDGLIRKANELKVKRRKNMTKKNPWENFNT